MRGAFAETRCGAGCGPGAGRGKVQVSRALPGGVQARGRAENGCEAGRAWAPPPNPAPRIVSCKSPRRLLFLEIPLSHRLLPFNFLFARANMPSKLIPPKVYSAQVRLPRQIPISQGR